MFTRKTALFVALVGVTATLTLTACAPQAAEVPTASPTTVPTTSAPSEYDGPLVFIGEEVATLLPSEARISALFDGAGTPGAASNVLDLNADGGGPEFDPAICNVLYREQPVGGVGARSMAWSTNAGDWQGSAHAIQFASADQAAQRFAEIQQAADSCSTFTSDAPESFSDVAVSEGADSTAVAGVLVGVPSERQWQAVLAYAVTGNTLVAITHPYSGQASFDTQAITDELVAVGDDAADTLREQLAERDPASSSEPENTQDGPWSEWQFSDEGVGPVRLGMIAGEILAVVPGAEITEAEFRPSRLSSADGAAHVWITFDDEGRAVQVSAGALRSIEPAEDGSVLPQLAGSRIGSPISEIVEELPGGTFIHSGSSGDSVYVIADREGRVFEVVLDTGARDSDAPVRGIRVADGTAESATLFE